jgi:membrane protein implicated in regulation of membrane protease activity
VAKFFKNNGLTIALLALFLVSIFGQWISGWHVENEELLRHGEKAISLGAYTVDPAFLSSVFENWESEFLQMSAYVVLTAMLVQRGSAESRDPDDPPRDADLERQSHGKGAPRILRAGRLARALYARSLGIALFALFLISFLLHWRNSAATAAAEAEQHGEAAVGALAYLGDPQLWFESFQNWQSEFLSTAVLIVLSIWLRQRESPESKAVAAPNDATGAA